MFFVIQYARVMHGIRRFLSRKGFLQRLDPGARESDGGLWLRSLFSVLDFEDFQTLDTPWWTLASGRKVRDFLASTPNARVLEWGSGASTVWLGKRSSEVFSIESDAAWANLVQDSVPPSRSHRDTRHSVSSRPRRYPVSSTGFPTPRLFPLCGSD